MDYHSIYHPLPFADVICRQGNHDDFPRPTNAIWMINRLRNSISSQFFLSRSVLQHSIHTDQSQVIDESLIIPDGTIIFTILGNIIYRPGSLPCIGLLHSLRPRPRVETARGMTIGLRRCATCGGTPSVQIEDSFGLAKSICPACLEMNVATLQNNGTKLHVQCSIEGCEGRPAYLVRGTTMTRWAGTLCRDHFSSATDSFDMVLALPRGILASNLPLTDMETLIRFLRMDEKVPRQGDGEQEDQ